MLFSRRLIGDSTKQSNFSSLTCWQATAACKPITRNATVSGEFDRNASSERGDCPCPQPLHRDSEQFDIEAAIYFAGKSGMRSDYYTGTTWVPKGQTPVVEATGQRFGLNLLSAVSPRGEFRVMLTKVR